MEILEYFIMVLIHIPLLHLHCQNWGGGVSAIHLVGQGQGALGQSQGHMTSTWKTHESNTNRHHHNRPGDRSSHKRSQGQGLSPSPTGDAAVATGDADPTWYFQHDFTGRTKGEAAPTARGRSERKPRMYRKSRETSGSALPRINERPGSKPDPQHGFPQSGASNTAPGDRINEAGMAQSDLANHKPDRGRARGRDGSAKEPRDTPAKTDPLVILLEQFEQKRVCEDGEPVGQSGSHTVRSINSSFSAKLTAKFDTQAKSALKLANVLNNLFRTRDTQPLTLYNDAFYYSLVRALVEEDRLIHGAIVAFDRKQYKSPPPSGSSTTPRTSAGAKQSQDFCPYVYKDKETNWLPAINLAKTTKGKYSAKGTKGYEWFWKLRTKDYSDLLWKHKEVCRDANSTGSVEGVASMSSIVTSDDEGMWTEPYVDCERGKTWVMTYSVPFFGCNSTEQDPHFKGVVAVDVDMEKMDINQCDSAKGVDLFAGTHKCRKTTTCMFEKGRGMHRGGYGCECDAGYYSPIIINSFPYPFDGVDVEREYRRKMRNKTSKYDKSYQCLPCSRGCVSCTGQDPCSVSYDVMMRSIPLGIESFCMTISLVLGFIILRLRKTKVMKATMWGILEIVIVGALLLYSTVVIQYFEPTDLNCLLIPWFREVGFAVVYGALILKVYRVLAEFQSRKAHRVHVRDKDLLKYLALIILIVVGYMAAWTAINLDHLRDGVSLLETLSTRDGLKYTICKSHWWDYVVEVAEFMFLVFGIYLCYCTRSAPSDYLERKYISWSIYNETVLSALFHITRHFLWTVIHPDYVFLMYFIRCQLTVTVCLIFVLGPKLWYAHRPPEDDHFRNRAYSTSDVHDSILPESMKLHVGVSSNGDVDVGEINLSEMDPDDIRAELKRLYTQLQIFKTKTMRKDNPHISKRRGGRKQTHRRFSLQAFHHKHKHHHSSEHDHDHEMSKTPEESTNSAEGVGCSIEESTCSVGEMRTPTVTFKPGHKSFY